MRDIEVRSGALENLDVDLIAVSAPGALVGPLAILDGWLGGVIDRCMEQGVYRGKADETSFFPSPPGHPHVLLVGVGEGAGTADDESPTASQMRAVAGVAVRFCREHRLSSLALLLPEAAGRAESVQAAAEGLMLGDFSYDALRAEETRSGRTAPSLALIWSEEAEAGAEAAASTGRTIADAQNFARDLVSRPGNVVTPVRLAEEAEALGERGIAVQVWSAEKLRKEGFGALLAVSKGSAEPPRFIILEHRGEGGSPIVLVGKGITFDSGGISLKPSKGMEEMKYDMAGAAAVLGAIRALSDLGTSRRIVALIPTAENLPSGNAVKPGDVIRGVSGRSIEIVNTDAEGRLVLSDALSYATRLGPSAIVDVATLTGGCVVALGRHAAGLMSNDDELARALEEASIRSGERVWRLPLWPEYGKQLESDIADIKNSGGREASPITAGYFLKEFVENVPWAHLDIAGTAWADEARAHQPKGATGAGVRLLVEWVRGAR